MHYSLIFEYLFSTKEAQTWVLEISNFYKFPNQNPHRPTYCLLLSLTFQAKEILPRKIYKFIWYQISHIIYTKLFLWHNQKIQNIFIIYLYFLSTWLKSSISTGTYHIVSTRRVFGISFYWILRGFFERKDSRKVDRKGF